MMTIKLDVKSDIRDLQRRLRRDQRVLIPKMVNQAVNTTARNAQSKAKSIVAKEAGLKARDVADRMRLFKSTYKTLAATVEAFGGAFNLARFKSRETKQGITATAWGKRKVYRGTFFAFGKRTVFVRSTEKRLPIRPVYGPSVPGTLAQDRIEREVQDHIEQRWPINLEQAARRWWKKK